MSTEFEEIFQHEILLCVRKQNVCRSDRSTRLFLRGFSQRAYLSARRTASAPQLLARNRQHQDERDRE
jgi:hypothetical protein